MADSIVYEIEGRKEPFWVSYINGRIAKRKNFLAVITGPTGSGKSWSALSVCNLVDPTFNKERIVTSMKQLMELVNSGKLKSGHAVLWDEAGIDISNRNWQSLINRMVNFLLQTFRHQRLILIMTVPYMDFIDASTRKLFHAEFLTQSINYEDKTVKVKPQLIQYNPRTKKFYYKYLRVRTSKGISPLKVWRIPKAPEDLINAYEDIKKTFTSSLNQDIERQLRQQEAKEKKNELEPLTDKQQEVMELLAQFGNVTEAAKHTPIPKRTLFFHARAAKKKGYTMEKYKEMHENEVL